MSVPWTVDFLCLWIAMPVVSIALALAFIRLAIGPMAADRVIAFELIAILLIGLLVLFAIASEQPVLLDVASIWAVISFFSVIAIAWYIERWGEP